MLLRGGIYQMQPQISSRCIRTLGSTRPDRTNWLMMLCVATTECDEQQIGGESKIAVDEKASEDF